MQAVNPAVASTYEGVEPLTSAEELNSALRLDPAKVQAYIDQLMGRRRGKHSNARAQRGAARVAKRKAKRK